MAPHSDKEAELNRILARAMELGRRPHRHSDMSDIEMVAAWREGTLGFEDIPEEILGDLIERTGRSEVAWEMGGTALGPQHEAPQAEIGSILGRAKTVKASASWWKRHAGWLAAAASIGAVMVITYSLQDVPPSPTPSFVPHRGPPLVTLQWPSDPLIDATRVSWGSARWSLPTNLPDFNRTGGTLGAPTKADRTVLWRQATVIVRTQDGWGSGAVISSDGWVLTSYQVVQGAAQRAAIKGEPANVQVITGRLVDGRMMPRKALEGTLYRADPMHDLALLKMTELPAGMKPLPALKLAAQVQDGEDCFSIGAQENHAAWWLRAGNVTGRLRLPQEMAERAGASRTAQMVRTRGTIVVSDIRISDGDAGGPLLNARGELIGITYGSTDSRNGGPVGWHVSVEHINRFVADLPHSPEGVPFDPWTAGVPEATLFEPQWVDADHNGHIDTLRISHAHLPSHSKAKAVPTAVTAFVDLRQNNQQFTGQLARIPAGLWGMESTGEFSFQLFMTARADGVMVAGYANPAGIVDEIRIGDGQGSRADTLWQRNGNGVWKATHPIEALPLLDASRVGEDNRSWIGSQLSNLLGPQPRAQGANSNTVSEMPTASTQADDR